MNDPWLDGATESCWSALREPPDDARATWIEGGSARPLIEVLIELKRVNEAAALARVCLAADFCPDRDEIEALLERAGSPPPGWGDSVIEFSRHPTPEN